MRINSLAPAIVAAIVLLAGCAPVEPTAPPAGSIPAAPNTPSNPPPQPPPAQKETVPAPPPAPDTPVSSVTFGDDGYTNFGIWSTRITAGPAEWQPGITVNIAANLTLPAGYLAQITQAGLFYDGFCLLVTAERTFDADGWLRLASDEKMSTLLTPTGLAIEGGVQGAVSKRTGYGFNTPVDELVNQSVVRSQVHPDRREISFNLQTKLPDDLPPGIYRLRFDYGFTDRGRRYSLDAGTFAVRPFFTGEPTASHIYSPPIRASGKRFTGGIVDASAIKPRIPWVLLMDYNSNGYSGVIADEDKSRFALSPRNLIPDEVILPLYNPDNKTRLSYSLEPRFPTDTIELRSAIPWDYTKGELSIRVTGSDGTTTDLGTSSFAGKKGLWPTTKNPAFIDWKPPAYGRYTVTATGWLSDIWGNRYEGGGTYRFWIAKRMTIATATFQGQSYAVGGRYGRDLGLDPAVPADIQATAKLYPASDPANPRSVSYKGKATIGGIFGSAQGMIPLMLDAPGEYAAVITANYTDQEGHLWVSTMRHAGVVYPADSPIIARGKKLLIGGKFTERGDTGVEGYIDADNVAHLQHINYPFLAGDMLLIASEQQGSNKIEPVLTYETKINPAPYDSRLQNLGATNLMLKTSNGYSPHLFPEYITDWAYYYAGAPRPGFMSRFLVAEDGVRAPYWPTSPNSFGGQIAASNNGDLPGVIYRLIGGVVLRQKGQAPAYSGYISNGFIMPKGSNNNRVVAAGSEDLLGSDGSKSRLFLVSTRPGMIYETGTAFAPAVQIDPILPAVITYTLTYPDGRKVTWRGTGDASGSFAGSERTTLDVPGVYRFTIEGDWQNSRGYMPGLSKEGGEFYVVEKEKPPGATGLRLNLPEQSSFLPNGKLVVTGNTTADTVNFAGITPGAVLTQGSVPASGGKFTYTFDPAAIAKNIPLYDIINLTSGKPEIKDVVQLTFFTTEKSPGGAVYHSAVRLILRGTTVLYVY